MRSQGARRRSTVDLALQRDLPEGSSVEVTLRIDTLTEVCGDILRTFPSDERDGVSSSIRSNVA